MVKKSTFVIIGIVVSILSILYIFLDYFGLLRFAGLHLFSNEKYKDIYSNLGRYKGDNRVYILINTKTERLSGMKPMINSILDQTVKTDGIIIYLEQPLLEDSSFSPPSFIRENVILLPRGKEYGTGFCNCLVPTILNEKDSNAIIILVKDDVVYGKDFIEALLDIHMSTDNVLVEDAKNYSMSLKINSLDFSNDEIQKCNLTDEWIRQKVNSTETINYRDNYKKLG